MKNNSRNDSRLKTILIHSIVFSPDGVSTAYLYNDIATKFLNNGYKVIVLTTTPHYNVIASELEKQPLTPKLFGLYYVSLYKGIKVIHLPQKKYSSSILRMLGFIYWHFLALIIGLSQNSVDMILSPSPPLTIGFINLIIGKLKSARVIYNVQEIYPDFLINQGKLKFKPLINFLNWMEKTIYDHSDAIVTIDKIFYNTIVGRFSNPQKLHIIPNFVDTELFRPMNVDSIHDKVFPEKKDTLKVMYAGNIGHAQDWEPLICIAKKLLSRNVEFWVIGEGVMKNTLVNQVEEHKLTNIHVLNYHAREQMPAIINYADLHFIFMSPDMERHGFPSKVYTIMACAKPLLVMSSIDTPISNFLISIGCAWVVNDSDFKNKCNAIVEILLDAKTNKAQLKSMGNKGYHLIKNSYSKEAVTTKYVNLANSLFKSR